MTKIKNQLFCIFCGLFIGFQAVAITQIDFKIYSQSLKGSSICKIAMKYPTLKEECSSENNKGGTCTQEKQELSDFLVFTDKPDFILLQDSQNPLDSEEVRYSTERPCEALFKLIEDRGYHTLATDDKGGGITGEAVLFYKKSVPDMEGGSNRVKWIQADSAGTLEMTSNVGQETINGHKATYGSFKLSDNNKININIATMRLCRGTQINGVLSGCINEFSKAHTDDFKKITEELNLGTINKLQGDNWVLAGDMSTETDSKKNFLQENNIDNEVENSVADGKSIRNIGLLNHLDYDMAFYKGDRLFHHNSVVPDIGPNPGAVSVLRDARQGFYLYFTVTESPGSFSG